MVELPEKIILCAISELPDPGSKGINVTTPEKLQEVFVVRVGDEVFGYQNHCPHTGANLDWLPDQFLDMTESFIQCATHGAIFRIEDGYCLRGPCAGESLQKLHLKVEQNNVVLYVKSGG